MGTSAAAAGVSCVSLSSRAEASIRLSSCVPAWVTKIVLPSPLVVTPQGNAAPRSTSSRRIVLSSFRAGASMMLMAFVLTQPRSNCVAGNSKCESTWTTYT